MVAPLVRVVMRTLTEPVKVPGLGLKSGLAAGSSPAACAVSAGKDDRKKRPKEKEDHDKSEWLGRSISRAHRLSSLPLVTLQDGPA